MRTSYARNFLVLALAVAHTTVFASPIVARHDSAPGRLCVNQTPPDSDLLGLGVRIGIYLQIIALALGVCCRQSDTLSAVPAAIMTSFTLNIVLTMKASKVVFHANPVVQDFWITQLQLFLLVTLLPFMFLFGRWHHKVFGIAKCVLVAVAIAYTYLQTFWFWLKGYQMSDEIVCGVAETDLFGRYKLFSQGGRFAIIALLVVGLIILGVMLPNFIKGSNGYLTWVVDRAAGESGWSKAMVTGVASAPLIAFVMVMIETAVRTGTQSQWKTITGQWLALGVGVFTAAEAVWHMVRAIYRELRGGEFSEDAESSAVDDKKTTSTKTLIE